MKKTANTVLYAQLVELFEQHPDLSSFSHDEQHLIFPTDNNPLTIHFDQVKSITIHNDTVCISLDNGMVYTATLTHNEVEVTLPHSKWDNC